MNTQITCALYAHAQLYIAYRGACYTTDIYDQIRLILTE